MDSLDPDVRFEPVRALVAGVDGLDAYWDLFRQCKKQRDILPRHITILIEIDPEQTERSIKLIRHYFPESTTRIEKDLQKNDRIVITEI
jgi:methylase of polypeptide subunit release factors